MKPPRAILTTKHTKTGVIKSRVLRDKQQHRVSALAAIAALSLSGLLAGCAGPESNKLAAPDQAALINPAPSAKPLGEMLSLAPTEIPLSPGDRLRILVDDGAPFSGIFQIDLDGQLHIPYIKPLPAVGLSVAKLQQNLAEALVHEGLFRAGYARASINILQWAPIQISVAGAVFQPGRVLLNDQQGSKAKDPSMQIAQEGGDYPVQRFLSYALKGAAGVKPIGDLQHVQLNRAGKTMEVDLSGIFSGKPVQDVPLIAGDQVTVPSVGRIQPEYMRPSQITPPGFEVFFSNLTQPVNGNTNTVIREERSIPYGSKLSLGLIAANCVGGVEMTNAGRDAVLVSHNPLTGQAETKRYSVTEVFEHVEDVAANPYLMPHDAIACFDSKVVNARETLKMIADFLGPIAMMMILL